MSTPAGVEPARPPASPELAALVAGVEGAMGSGSGAGRFSAGLRQDARRVLERARGRLGLGLAHTVVALAGATGSGKSSMFNAITGLDIATVGVRRPTTASPTACVWGPGGEQLLQWLKVPVANRSWRESALDADRQKPLHGLILLDLPDHDSTAESHREESDRLVELVDLLVWVVDPQKYADNALHERYLRPLAEHADLMVVVMNQIDTLPAGQRGSAVADLKRLLAEDGLAEATVLPASAVTGEGIPELRDLLSKAVSARRASTERLRVDLEAIAARIRAELGAPAPDIRELTAGSGLLEALVDAAGVGALTETVRTDYARRAYVKTGWPPLTWLQRLRPDPLGRAHGSARAELIRAAVPATTKAQRARVNLSTHELCVKASAGLPTVWKDAVFDAEKGSRADLTETLDGAVGAVRIEAVRPGWWGAVKVLQYALLAIAVIGGLWLLALGLFDWLRLPPVPGFSLGLIPVPTILFLGGIVLSILLCLIARAGRRTGAARASARVEADLRQAIAGAANSTFLAPVAAVLDEHRALVGRLGAKK